MQIKWDDVPVIKPKSQFSLPATHYRVLDNSIQISADGKRVALAYSKGLDGSFVQVWQISDKPKVIFEAPKDHQTGHLALSPSGKRVFASDRGSVFDVDTRKPIARVSAAFYSCIFFKDEDTVVSAHRSYNYSKPHKSRITVWNVATNKDAGSFDVPDGRFVSAYPGNKGKEIWLFLEPDKCEIACYDIAEKSLVRTISPDPDDPKKPLKSSGIYRAVAPDEVAFATHVNSLNVYDGIGKVLWRAPTGGNSLMGGMENGLIHSSRYLGKLYEKKLGQPEKIAVCDWKTGKGLAVLEGFASGQTGVLAAASADGKTVVAVAKQGQVLVFDVSSVK
jgi:hypothetical protein